MIIPFVAPATTVVSDLEKILGGAAVPSVPVPWTGMPYLNAIRKLMIAFGSTAPGALAEDDGLTIIRLGQLSEVYNLVNALDAAVYTTRALASRNSVYSVDAGVASAYQFIPMALRELQQLKTPLALLQTLSRYANSDFPATRVSGVATALVFAALIQLHP